MDCDFDKKWIMDKLFDRYDKEINNLWQRSVFIATFITLISTGYGILLKYAITEGCNDKINCAMALLAGLGAIFSLLWIFMAKGSKAWQEHYEMKINAFSELLGLNEYINSNQFLKDYGIEPKILGKINKKRYNKYFLTNYECNKTGELNNDLSYKLLNPSAYSVGKINIFIGYVLLAVYGVALIFHHCRKVCIEQSFCGLVRIILMLTLVISIAFLWMSRILVSGGLQDAKIDKN